MAITLVMGFDEVVPRQDHEIPDIEGYPFRWTGRDTYLQVIRDSVLNDRCVLEMTTNGTSSPDRLKANSRDVFHQFHNEKTVWYIGYRFRYNQDLSSRPISDGGGLRLTAKDDRDVVLADVFDNDELTYYFVSDRYTYMEVGINWSEGTIERWVDGYKLADKDLPTALAEADSFDLLFSAHHGGGNTVVSRWTDFYFMVDTSHVEGDDTPSKRLGGAYVRHLEMGDSDVGDKWDVSNGAMTPLEIVNVPLEGDLNSRLDPYVITSIAEDSATFFTALPTPGQMHRLGRGDIKFVQFSINAHRFNGSTAAVFARVVDKTSEGVTPEKEFTMYVDDYEGRPVAYMNATNTDEPWTPERLVNHGVELYTRSGGGQ